MPGITLIHFIWVSGNRRDDRTPHAVHTVLLNPYFVVRLSNWAFTLRQHLFTLSFFETFRRSWGPWSRGRCPSGNRWRTCGWRSWGSACGRYRWSSCAWPSRPSWLRGVSCVLRGFGSCTARQRGVTYTSWS